MRYATFNYGQVVLYETPIFIDDRQESDVQAAIAINEKITAEGWGNLTEEEQSRYLSGIGALRAADLNRIEYRTSEVLAMFHLLGYDALEMETKADWTRSDLISQSEMRRILENIQSLLDTYNHDIGQPLLSYEEYPDYEGINAMEEALKLLDRTAKNIAHCWHQYSGATHAGGGIL